MPPAANENQGLKIAVAAFVTLTVVLAVTTYFGFSSYSQSEAKLEDASKKLTASTTVQGQLQTNLTDLKEKAGFKGEDSEIGNQFTKHQEAQKQAVTTIRDKVRSLLGQAKAAGLDQAKTTELEQTVETITQSYLSEPNQTLTSGQARLVELLNTLAQLDATLATEYTTTRAELASIDAVAKKKIDTQVAAAQKAQADLEGEHRGYEESRTGLQSKLDELQTQNSKQAAEITRLQQQLAQNTEDFNKARAEFRTILSNQRERLELNETVLDKADGLVDHVDYRTGEIHTNIRQDHGARPTMQMTIFDRGATGLTSDKPKARVELVRFDRTGSTFRILKTMSNVNPVRVGDQVYSPVWDRNDPLKVALIGKIDMDRDGRDDRQDLRRLIERVGGTVVYDLPPPGIGSETGELRPLTDYYVLDELIPIHPTRDRPEPEDAKYNEKRTKALETARANNVRPIKLERLLPMLGYSFDMNRNSGRVEAIDRDASQKLTNPKGRVNVNAQPKGEAPAESTETPPASDEPK